ncbi:MAG TPA: hypothetical protein VHW74_14575 [Mycobacteriales bacterium]|nr:hypothetical protein [Mycobacteriales bacterium]
MNTEERLQAAGRKVDASGFAERSTELAGQIANTQRRSFLGSRKRMIAVGAAGMILVPGVAVAATLHFTAETGHYGPPGLTESDTSEFINMCAPDIRAFVATLAPTSRPLPAGTTWPELIDQVATPAPGDCPPSGPGEIQQVTGLRVRLLMATTCPWDATFLHADDTGDAAGRTYAGKQLASTYDAINAIGGYGDDNWKPLRDAAAAGSRPLVERDYRANCEPTQ